MNNGKTFTWRQRAMTKCTCKISHTPCNFAFVYDSDGQTLAEIPIKHTPRLRHGLTALCAGVALQKLNMAVKANG